MTEAQETKEKPDYYGHRARLRERFMVDEGASMPDYEILELLLTMAIPRRDVKPIAYNLLNHFDNKLEAVFSADYDELCKVRDLFTRFGGHKMAAGLSMNAGTAETLRERLNEQCTLSDDDLVEKMKIDIPLPVGYVDDALVEELETLEPFGIANPRPLFAQKDVPVRRIDLFGSDRKVLKLKLEGNDASGNTRVIDAVCFDNAAEAYEELKDSKTVSVLYQAGFNEYQGRRSVQLVIKDYMPS